MKGIYFNSLDDKSEKKIKGSVKESTSKYVLIGLTVAAVFTIFFTASLIIINSGISLNIDLSLCYRDFIIAGIILLIFLKSYRITHSTASNYKFR